MKGLPTLYCINIKKPIPQNIKRWAGEFMDQERCCECHGARLNQEALNFKIDENLSRI